MMGFMRKRMAGLASTLLTLAMAAETGSIEPQDFAAKLQAKGAKPEVLQVGFAVLYRSKHIPGSVYAGPASKAEGLDALKAAVANLPRDREIVIYCGCCPWDKCPNVKPALESLRQMGFAHVKALVIPTNFAADWIDHGYPVEQGEAVK
jgi:thiosulfate/3-mercaptopyruvate sulfurtransferase